MKINFFFLLAISCLWFTQTSCNKDIKGCTNPKAENFNPDANIDDGFCFIKGCTNPKAENFNAEATIDNGSCVLKGCTDKEANNFDALANMDDGSCKYPKDLFIGKYVGKLECNNAILKQFVGAQEIDIIIEEIAGEKKKVKVSINTQIPGAEPVTAEIEGKKFTYAFPETEVELPNLGKLKITNEGEFTLQDDPNKLKGIVKIKISSPPLISIEDECTINAVRKP
ncbi:MAG: hypothetical protein RLZZ546_2964 [Bacteroidota bacterium]|jgi:hypothetical protein